MISEKTNCFSLWTSQFELLACLYSENAVKRIPKYIYTVEVQYKESAENKPTQRKDKLKTENK